MHLPCLPRPSSRTCQTPLPPRAFKDTYTGTQHARTSALRLQVHTQAQHIKFVVELYDKCHVTTQQYIQFLQVGGRAGVVLS